MLFKFKNLLGLVFDLKRVPEKEHLKFFSTGLMFFFIALSYAIGRRLKDVLISTKVAVEIISFIKPVIVLPSIFFITFALMYAVNHAKDKKKFTDNLVYFVSFPFIVYYLFYGIIDFIGGEALFDKLSPKIDLCSLFCFCKTSFVHFYLYEFSLVLNKIYHVLFYTFTEIYGALVLSYCFWTFVNTYTNIQKASIFYPQYTIFSSFSIFVSGTIGVLLPYILYNLMGLSNELYTKFSVLLSILICVFSMLISTFFYKISLREHKLEEEQNTEQVKTNKKKEKLSFFQSVVALLQDRIVLCLFLCVVSYMTCINLVEITWKKTILNYCKQNENSRMLFDTILSCLHLGVGISTIIMSRVCIYVLLHFGWLFTALISPISLGGTGVLFFVFMYLKLNITIKGVVISSLLIAVLVGMFQNILSKTCKYSFFDNTKEIGFLNLSKNKRDQSKSAIDMLGGRFGKSLGSIIQQFLLATFVPASQLHSGQEIIGKYICFILLSIIVVWLLAVFVLSSRIQNNRDNSDDTKQNEEPDNKTENKSDNKSDNKINNKAKSEQNREKEDTTVNDNNK